MALQEHLLDKDTYLPTARTRKMATQHLKTQIQNQKNNWNTQVRNKKTDIHYLHSNMSANMDSNHYLLMKVHKPKLKTRDIIDTKNTHIRTNLHISRLSVEKK